MIANGAEVFAARCLVRWWKEKSTKLYRHGAAQRTQYGSSVTTRYEAKELETALQPTGSGVVLKASGRKTLTSLAGRLATLQMSVYEVCLCMSVLRQKLVEPDAKLPSTPLSAQRMAAVPDFNTRGLQAA